MSTYRQAFARPPIFSCLQQGEGPRSDMHSQGVDEPHLGTVASGYLS